MWRSTGKLSSINGAAASVLAILLLSPALAQEPEQSNQPKVTTQTEVLTGKSVSPMLIADSATRMIAIAERYRNIIANGGFPKVSKGSYKKGSESKNVIALNRRLFLDGYLRQEAVEGEFASRVTSATIDALTRFQRNVGLAATGKMDAPTVAALNIPAQARLRTIEANVARLELYAKDLGDRYVIVNIPAQQIETVSNGKVYSRHNAIVGRPERPTPVVMTALSDVNFNPYWNTPPSIIERDLIPKMLSGTQILRDMNIKVFKGFGGPEIDPDDVNWRTAIADDYHFRQEPGPENAMATAKINFPSPFGVYLHDTPEKHLFKTGVRLYSSGCIRVENVEVFLNWVLNGQENIGSAEISALAETLERRDVKLEAPPQLRVAYLTAWPVGGTVAFRPDFYELDGSEFVAGQPMPIGEVSDEGLRYVLKPVPRKPAAVDAAEAEGFSLFGRRSSKSKRTASFYGFEENDSSYIRPKPERGAPPAKRLPFAVKKKEGAATALVKTPEPKRKAGSKKEFDGLFDWAAYRKEQKQGVKKPAVASGKSKKKITPKKAEAEVAAIAPKAKVPAVKKPVDEKAALKRPEVAAKKPATEQMKKPAVADKKKIETPVKKVAEVCKPAAGKDCKAPVAKKAATIN